MHSRALSIWGRSAPRGGGRGGSRASVPGPRSGGALLRGCIASWPGQAPPVRLSGGSRGRDGGEGSQCGAGVPLHFAGEGTEAQESEELA